MVTWSEGHIRSSIIHVEKSSCLFIKNKIYLKKADHWQNLAILSPKNIQDAYPTSVTKLLGQPLICLKIMMHGMVLMPFDDWQQNIFKEQ